MTMRAMISVVVVSRNVRESGRNETIRAPDWSDGSSLHSGGTHVPTAQDGGEADSFGTTSARCFERDASTAPQRLRYLDGTFSSDKLRSALQFDREHGDFRPVALIVDGFDFDGAAVGDLEVLRSIAVEADAELWMSAVTHRESVMNEHGVPEPVAHIEQAVDVILRMAHDTKAVHVSLLKDHDASEVSPLKLALDPTTLLLKKES